MYGADVESNRGHCSEHAKTKAFEQIMMLWTWLITEKIGRLTDSEFALLSSRALSSLYIHNNNRLTKADSTAISKGSLMCMFLLKSCVKALAKL